MKEQERRKKKNRQSMIIDFIFDCSVIFIRARFYFFESMPLFPMKFQKKKKKKKKKCEMHNSAMQFETHFINSIAE